MALLADLSATPSLATMSQAELIALVQRMQASKGQRITMKVTEKGALSLYGLGRFPVTLYASQWRKLLAEVSAIQTFLTTNAALLTEKPTT